MNATAISTLLLIKDSPAEAVDICSKLGITRRQLQRIVKELSSRDYITSDAKISLKLNAKTTLFKKVASKFDTVKLVHDSNEDVLLKLTTPKGIDELTKETTLSQITVYRVLNELRSIGAVTEEDGKFTLNLDKDLQLFVNLLNTEGERMHIEPYANILYSDNHKTLKSTPVEHSASGELTAFSVFSDYGIEYHTTRDYYIEQDEPIRIEDILIHSIVAADKENNKTALIMAIIFYVKARDRIAIDTIRRIAHSFKIHELWLDVEAYVRRLPLKYNEKFLPWQEFEQKAQLYELKDYELPPPYPQLFEDIGRNLDRPVEMYLLGGENMRLKELKSRTKDCDAVLRDGIAFKRIKDALTKMGYKPLGSDYFSEDDKRIDPSAILVHSHRSRMDLFTELIANKLYLSEGMVKRSEIRQFGKLKLGIMSNEDVFLLKSLTDRDGDIEDIAKLAQSQGFNWDVVFDELVYQERESGRNFSNYLLDSLELLKERTGIEAPFYRKLVSRALENTVVNLVLKGKNTISEIADLTDFPEYAIRNKVNKLVIQRRIIKEVGQGGTVLLKPSQRTVMTVESRDVNIQRRIIDQINRGFRIIMLSEEEKKIALQLMESIKDHLELVQRRPSAVVAGIIYTTLWIASRKGVRHSYPTRKDIAEVFDVNPVTVTKMRSIILRIVKERNTNLI